MSLEKYFKPTLHTKFGGDRRQKENVITIKLILTSPSNFFCIFENSHFAKNI